MPYAPPAALADRFHRVPADPGDPLPPDGLVRVWDPRPIGWVPAGAVWAVLPDDPRVAAADAGLKGVDFDAL